MKASHQMDLASRFRCLRQVGLFQAVDDSTLENIANRCQWYRYSKRGDHIITQGDADTSLGFLVAGTARTTAEHSEGRPFDFDLITEGNMFGELGCIDEQPRSASIVAESPCIVAFISRSEFLEISALNNPIGLALAQHMTRRQRELTERVIAISAEPVVNRLARFLISQVSAAPVDNRAIIRNCPSQDTIGRRIDCLRESVAKAFKHLTDKGIIERDGKDILIRDWQKLRDLARTV